MAKTDTKRLTFSGSMDIALDEYGQAMVPAVITEAVKEFLADIAAVDAAATFTARLFGLPTPPVRTGRPRGSKNKAAVPEPPEDARAVERAGEPSE